MQYDLLKDILSQPTAPFCEFHVVRLLCRVLQKAHVPYFLDPVGNIVVGVTSRKEYLQLVKTKSQDPLRVFMAHMDHPGFHGMRWERNGLRFRWHGGSPLKHLNGAAFWLATAIAGAGEGKLVRFSFNGTRSIGKGLLKVPPRLQESYPKAQQLFGGFTFRAPVWQRGKILYTTAADDLVGCYAITELGLRLKKTLQRRANFLGLLTRAEEVGFVGAIGHFELGWLQQARRPVLCISLETSKTLPDAEVGKGPVVRLGDRKTVFDPGALQLLTELAARRLRRYQRRVMDGGTCEATAALAFGFRAVGISIPLGNYHNQSFDGGPDSRGPLGPAPEFVHMDDIEGMLTLCQQLMTSDIHLEAPWKRTLQTLQRNKSYYHALLRGNSFHGTSNW